MTLRQLLLIGKSNDIKLFFKDVAPAIAYLLSEEAMLIQAYPEEMRTREIFLSELEYLKEEKDFSDFGETERKVLESLAETTEWDDFIDKAIEVIRTC